MSNTTRMGHETLEDEELRIAVEDLNGEDSGLSMDGSQTRMDFNTNKKRRQSRLFDSTTFDSSRTWFSQEARRFSTKATNLIVQVPALQLRRIAQTSGVHSIRTETQHFVGIATLHGPLRIYRSRGKYRLFWVTAMIICLTMMLYQTYKLIELYLEKPIVSQVSFLQPEEGMEFPLVTLCNFNFINRQNLADFQKRENVTENFINFILQSIVDIGVLSTFVDEKNLTKGHLEYNEYMKNNPSFSVNEFFRSSSVTCNETLRICNIGAEEFDCCNYSKVIMTDMGNCYQIDLKDHPSSTTKQIGVSNGLQIYANFHWQEHDNPQKSLNIPDFLINNEIGFRYFVHSRTDYPFITSEGIGVQLGYRTFSAISPNRFVLMNRNQGGKCIEEWPDEFLTKNLTLFKDGIGEYSSTKCVALCLGTFFHDICGCTPFLYNYNGTFPTCTAYQNYYECVDKSLNISATSTADEIMKRVNPPCLNSCKMECKRWDYQIFNSYSQPFSRSATAYLMKHEKLRQAKLNRDFVGIDIYYRDIAYTEYKQIHQTSMSQIWSSLGGNMGLFLGMSLLSVIEVIIYLCKISWLFFSSKRRQHMIAKDEKKRLRKMGISGIIEAANKVSMPSSTNQPSSPSISSTIEPPTMKNRLRKFADSIKKKSTVVWPRSPGFEEMQNPESRSGSSSEDFPSYYLNNLVTERTHGMGRAMNAQNEDFVELELEIGSESSSPSGSRRAAPATIKRSRTLSMSMDDKNTLAAELEKRRPTYISLEVTRAEIKALANAQKPNNQSFFRRSFHRLASNAIKPTKNNNLAEPKKFKFEDFQPIRLNSSPPALNPTQIMANLSPTQKPPNFNFGQRPPTKLSEYRLRNWGDLNRIKESNDMGLEPKLEVHNKKEINTFDFQSKLEDKDSDETNTFDFQSKLEDKDSDEVPKELNVKEVKSGVEMSNSMDLNSTKEEVFNINADTLKQTSIENVTLPTDFQPEYEEIDSSKLSTIQNSTNIDSNKDPKNDIFQSRANEEPKTFPSLQTSTNMDSNKDSINKNDIFQSKLNTSNIPSSLQNSTNKDPKSNIFQSEPNQSQKSSILPTSQSSFDQVSSNLLPTTTKISQQSYDLDDKQVKNWNNVTKIPISNVDPNVFVINIDPDLSSFSLNKKLDSN